MNLDLSNSNMSVESSAERPEQGPVEYRLAGLIFYCFVFIVGVIVNITALWVFSLTTKRRNSVTVYMINVAMVDLTFILLLPFRMVYHHQDYWPFGDVFCRVMAALTIFYPCIALWLFALISADRYMAIVQPRHGKELRNVPKAVVACLGVWLMTLGCTVPMLFSEHDPDQISNFTTCVKMQDIVYLRRDNAVNFARIVFFFLVPICIMIGCYIVIVDNLIHGRTSKLKPKVKQKSIRIIITLIIQVLVCFVPFHVCLLVRLIGTGQDGGFSTWAVFTTFLMNMSTVLDIILYYIVSKQFQDRVISVILYRNYLRSVRRKSRHTMSNVTSAMI
ncbi:N-arachidonyl glycine receptor isoform X1 [Hippoglossus hippoglossus]|uniref:N-arachidonyl glycine receptor isoform X1 n=2 Tax=Hippoglossus hippoglossus TaxID=8267 RepID=UPI00148CCD3E|nr:N-arachidonyl glycine receptor isoform X1 [Hippoglossus hippoglossus]XP_034429602.1 N-arachidonyl glycine receptor isoform X1 [Hippoglossus hippoglossus]XP_034429603.1 N-arachidonyl glycine receptor isoform X1 [Hippoglossus hippoglossus]